jgi:hypothetical protein
MTDKVITFVATPELQKWIDDMARNRREGKSISEAARSVLTHVMLDDKAHPEEVPLS